MVSTFEDIVNAFRTDESEFQSRNRESFGFYGEQKVSEQRANRAEFQSRNRESFGFYPACRQTASSRQPRFNLVIESLLVST